MYVFLLKPLLISLYYFENFRFTFIIFSQITILETFGKALALFGLDKAVKLQTISKAIKMPSFLSHLANYQL